MRKLDIALYVAVLMVLLPAIAFSVIHPIVMDESGHFVQVCYQLTLHQVPHPYHPIPCGMPWVVR